MPATTLLDTLKAAGFKGEGLRTAWAIAMRESGGRPDAFNGNTKTGDRSFGLFQINTLGPLQARVKQYGLSSERDLLNPLTNAKVAYQMSKGGTDFGAWGIGPNAYRQMPALNYSGFPGGGAAGAAAPAAASVPQALTNAPAAAPGGVDKKALAMALIGYSTGGGHDISPLLAALQTRAPAPAPAAPRATASALGGAPMYAAKPGTDPYGVSRYGLDPISGTYKQLGTPGQGTHSHTEGPNNWQSDNAYDLGVPVGTPVYAPASGRIDPNHYGALGPQTGGRFDGLRVDLYGAKNAYYLAHLSKLVVKPGEQVKAGQLIGYSGSANGVPHVHYGIENI